MPLNRDILKPWIEVGLVSLRKADYNLHLESQGSGQWRAHDSCFKEFGNRYKWIANFDVDEWVIPLDEPCLPDLLAKYQNYSSLQVGWTMVSAEHIFMRRDHMTVFEASNFTLGAPHSLVKPLCNTGKSPGFPIDMAHCCHDSADGYHRVDEQFRHNSSDPCWVLPSHTNTKERVHVTLMHTRALSFEEFAVRWLRRVKGGNQTVFDGDTRGGLHLLKIWKEYKQYQSTSDNLKPNPMVFARMQNFTLVLNSVLIGRERLRSAVHPYHTLHSKHRLRL